MTKEKEIKENRKMCSNWYEEGFIDGKSQAQKDNICSLCKENLEGSQILCWNCLCKIKDDVREDVKKDILKMVEEYLDENLEAYPRYKLLEIKQRIEENR
ncbi:MAG: hypothetical protein PHZ25_01665 [Candidatus Pacebacteria bacterium]|nr:hypothetical protein [Candidatus Paceibacterota bacterium]